MHDRGPGHTQEFLFVASRRRRDKIGVYNHDMAKKFYCLEIRIEQWVVNITNIKGVPGFHDIAYSFQAVIREIDYQGYANPIMLGYGNTIIDALVDIRNRADKSLVFKKDMVLSVISDALAIFNVDGEQLVSVGNARLN